MKPYLSIYPLKVRDILLFWRLAKCKLVQGKQQCEGQMYHMVTRYLETDDSLTFHYGFGFERSHCRRFHLSHLDKILLIWNCFWLIIIEVFTEWPKITFGNPIRRWWKTQLVNIFFIFQLTLVTACHKQRTRGLMDEITWEIFNLSKIPSI